MYYVSRICHRRVCHLRHQKSQSPIQRPAWLLGCHLNQLLSNNRLVQVSPFGLPTASFRVDLSRYPQISPSSSLELRLVKSQSSWWQNGPFGMWYVRSGTLHFRSTTKTKPSYLWDRDLFPRLHERISWALQASSLYRLLLLHESTGLQTSYIHDMFCRSVQAA